MRNEDELLMATPWPKRPIAWTEDRTWYVSVPFTWNLPSVRAMLMQGSYTHDRVVVGGPAVALMPDYLSGTAATTASDMPGVLQRVNPMATRTTTGCPNRCGFCAIGTGAVEGGGFRELDDWPDLPIICDNNLLAASDAHFDRVIDRCARWGWADFNQGLDARLLTERHARRLAEVKRPMIRLALDHDAMREVWLRAVGRLRAAGIAQRAIRTYCLIAHTDGPAAAWDRLLWAEAQGVCPLPMWFHPLDALKANAVTSTQRELGWTDDERKNVMGWFYKHRGHRGPLFDAPAPRRATPAGTMFEEE